jgi:nucleoside-diphosphate-sugar epimerase
MSSRDPGRRALVTGGAGFIGSHIADRLVGDGWSVRILDDFSSGREENLADCQHRIELLRGDLRDPEFVARAVRDVEVVFHQAALASVPRSVAEPQRTNHVNITGTLGLLEAARRAGVRRLVFAASSSAYGDTPTLPKVETMPANPMSPYALQKYVGEVYCSLYTRLYGLETVALRYFNVYGHGDGEQTRDFSFVSDAVQANLLAADAPRASGTVMNVAGGRRVSLNQLLRDIIELTGANVEPHHDPPRSGDVRDSLADLGRAGELLGYTPRVQLRKGLLRTIDYFREQPQGEAGK